MNPALKLSPAPMVSTASRLSSAPTSRHSPPAVTSTEPRLPRLTIMARRSHGRTLPIASSSDAACASAVSSASLGMKTSMSGSTSRQSIRHSSAGSHCVSSETVAPPSCAARRIGTISASSPGCMKSDER